MNMDIAIWISTVHVKSVDMDLDHRYGCEISYHRQTCDNTPTLNRNFDILKYMYRFESNIMESEI